MMKLFSSRFPIILASSSPRRQAYLKELGLSFTVLVPKTDEIIDNSKTPAQNAQSIASQKANAILKDYANECSNALIIAADTVVVLDTRNYSSDTRYIPSFQNESYFQGDMQLDKVNKTLDVEEPKGFLDNKHFEILGKPQNTEEAFLMLKKLNGQKHQVITAVSIILPDKEEVTCYDTTDVYFQHFTDSVLQRYANSGEGLDKAGSYAIQEKGGFLVERIEGALSTVVGLPVHKLLHYLIERNIVL